MSRGVGRLGETPATLAAPTENRIIPTLTLSYYYSRHQKNIKKIR